MGKTVSIILLVLMSVLLSSCSIKLFEFTPRDICNPELNVSKEQVENDLNNNKQEYLDMIEILSEYYIGYLRYYEDQSNELDNNINIEVYVGNDEEIFKSGNYTNDNQSKLYRLSDFDKMTQEEKEVIKTFVENRNSKEIDIYNLINGNNQVEFYFFGLTYIIYENNEFSIETMPCPND